MSQGPAVEQVEPTTAPEHSIGVGIIPGVPPVAIVPPAALEIPPVAIVPPIPDADPPVEPAPDDAPSFELFPQPGRIATAKIATATRSCVD